MIKFREIGAYKTTSNVGFCTTPAILTNGMGVTINEATGVVALPTATTAKGDVYIVMNRIDAPETLAPDDYKIAIGECPRVFRLKSLDGRILDMNDLAVTTAYASISAGDTLTLATTGKWVVNATLTGYETYLKVMEKTDFGGNGLAVKVMVAPVTILSNDDSISGITVDSVVATGSGNTYAVELTAGTVLADLVAADVVVTATDTDATVGTATTADAGKTWKVVVTAEDGIANETYTINATVAA